MVSRLRLSREAYDRLRHAVLKRDGWRCQQCGRRTNLEVHHLQHRSQQGDDAEQNLLTLCADCHARHHGISVVRNLSS
jgi:5-methylcytosine-specific restriction endonuclease McrA